MVNVNTMVQIKKLEEQYLKNKVPDEKKRNLYRNAAPLFTVHP